MSVFPFTALVDAVVRKETDEIRNILESEDVDINGYACFLLFLVCGNLHDHGHQFCHSYHCCLNTNYVYSIIIQMAC